MKRTQIGWVFFALIPSLVALIYFGNPQSTAILPVSIISALVLLLFFKLTIQVDDTHVRFWFGIGLIRFKFPLNEITNCKPLSYSSLGWGIRYRPEAILYNVSGNKAVSLTLAGRDRQVWIGTDKPKEIADFINAKLMPKEDGVK